MIVRAALPLVAEFGTAVTTQQVARAAGIGEATIFRVFADKDALIDACIVEALDSTHVLSELGSIPLDQPLPARLIEAVDALRGYLGRMGSVIGALHATGRPMRRPGGASGFPGGGASGFSGAGRPSVDADPDSPGGPSAGPAADGDRHLPGGREAVHSATREAIADLLEPDAASLRLPADRLAEVFLGLAFSIRRMPVGAAEEITPEELVDIFLNGSLTD
jgi:AcrR family transcriptional regulator